MHCEEAERIMAKLEAGITREDAFALLSEHNKEPFHIEHAVSVLR